MLEQLIRANHYAILLMGCLAVAIGLVWLAARVLTKSRQAQERRAELELANQMSLSRLEYAVQQIESRLAKTEEGVRSMPANPQQESLCTTTRAKAIRLHRLGQTPEQVAEVLATPVGEVKLILKVHELMLHRLVGAQELEAAEYQKS